VRLSALLTALLARLEPRHWVALGASAVLHLAVYLGMDTEPPPEPKPVSFEIALEPPKPESPARAKGKTKSADTKAKKVHAKRKPAKREPHVLEAKWRGEAKPAPDAPRLDLPDARALGVQAPVEEIVKPGAATRPSQAKAEPAPQAVQTETPAPSQAGAQTADAAQLSDPGTGGGATAAGSAGEPGIALAASTSLSRGGINPGGLSRGGQGSDPHAGLAAGGSPGQAGPGSGSLATSQGSGTGINLAAGAGAQNRSSLEAPPLSGGEPQGIRLSAAGTLAERANLPAGAGGLAAGQVSVETGRAAPNQAKGSGSSLASAQAGGAAANPQATAGGAKTGANPDTPTTQAKGKGPGGAASERAATAGADGSGGGKTLVASFGGAGQATAGSQRIGMKSAGSGPGTSQSGKTLALAPGEPGSSPTLAVTLQPLVAKPGAGRGGAGGGPALSSEGTGGGGAYPGATQVRSGGGEGGGASLSGLALANGMGGASAAPAGMRSVTSGHGVPSGGAIARSGVATGSPDQEPARLKTVKVADTQIIRPDSQAKPLDVLAPSTYCPLPLPGHSFPDNRPPKAEKGDDSLPAYAPDNPGFVFPIQAWAGNIQGKAIVRVEVQPDGKPGRMWLKQSSGSGLLDRDAQSQLTFWRFIPARKNGQPVTAWIDVPVVYRLQDAKK
jgi:TonB family protein